MFKKLKELGYVYYGKVATKYYKGFELKLKFYNDFIDVTSTVDLELYGPMTDEIKKEQDEAYEIIRNDIEIIKKCVYKKLDNVERKLISLGYRKNGLEFYIKKKDFLEFKINYDKDDEGFLEEYCGISISDTAGYTFYNEKGIDNFSLKLKIALKELKEDISIIKNIIEKDDNIDK